MIRCDVDHFAEIVSGHRNCQDVDTLFVKCCCMPFRISLHVIQPFVKTGNELRQDRKQVMKFSLPVIQLFVKTTVWYVVPLSQRTKTLPKRDMFCSDEDAFLKETFVC